MFENVSDRFTVSVDCRGYEEDRTTLLEPGTVTHAVLPARAAEIPVGEIRAIIAGTEVRIVASETHRAGVFEITLDMLSAVAQSEDYRRVLHEWLIHAQGS
tara:strand:- start:2930 stop:3232 length:303 start_codon:yes stop_codon:yes gene_type:complete